MRLLVFAASHRPESYNRRLAKLAGNYAAAHGANVDFAEYGDFDMPLYNDTLDMPEAARGFADRAAAAGGIIISSPEYNWSYPASLKNIIDWTSCLAPNPLAGKTVLLMSATPGSRGGILGLNHLKTPLEALQLFVFPKVFPLSHAERGFAGDSTLTDKKQQENLYSLLDDYLNFTRKLS